MSCQKIFILYPLQVGEIKPGVKNLIKELIKQNDMEGNKTALNQIFFGPPGTGKTYHTINESIKIADPEFYKENYYIFWSANFCHNCFRLYSLFL